MKNDGHSAGVLAFTGCCGLNVCHPLPSLPWGVGMKILTCNLGSQDLAHHSFFVRPRQSFGRVLGEEALPLSRRSLDSLALQKFPHHQTAMTERSAS